MAAGMMDWCRDGKHMQVVRWHEHARCFSIVADMLLVWIYVVYISFVSFMRLPLHLTGVPLRVSQ